MVCHTALIQWSLPCSPQELTDRKLNRTLIHIFTCIHAKAICLCYIYSNTAKAKVSNNLFILKMAPYVYVRLYRANP